MRSKLALVAASGILFVDAASVVCLSRKASAQPTEASIIFEGSVINETTQHVLAGQQITLTTAPPPVDGQSQLWSVTGYTVAGYTPTPKKFDTASVRVPDFSGTSTRFYWTTPGVYKLFYLYTPPQGPTVESEATFVIAGPEAPQVTTTFTSETIEEDVLRFGDKTTGVAGVTFEPKVKVPAANPERFYWVQIIVDYNFSYILENGKSLST